MRSYFGLKFSFCSQTANTFRSRSKLTEFYKQTHPDILNNAPVNLFIKEQIKEENLKSIKNLNQYLDSVNQNLGVESLNLKFYISDKQNKKGRKFYLIDIKLGSLKSQVSQEFLQKHIDQCTEKLIQSLITEKIQTDQYMRDAFDGQTKYENQFYKEDQYSMKPLSKNHFVKYVLQGFRLGLKIKFEKNLFILQRELIDKIDQQLFIFDEPKSKPLMWSKIIANESGFYKNSNKLFQNIIDPRLIYVDENIDSEQFQQFLKITLPIDDYESSKLQKYSQKVFNDMENENPQILLHVTNQFSVDLMPGFLSIPFNYDHKNLSIYYSANKEIILNNRNEYEQILNRIKLLESQFKQDYNILLELQATKNIMHGQQLIMTIKRLRNFIQKKGIKVIKIDQQGQNQNGVIYVKNGFDENKLIQDIQQMSLIK